MNIDAMRSREWLETNGLGGFASSTVSGMNTRRYHGLLVAATQPPVGRMVLLSKLEETLVVNGRAVALSVNRYPGVVHPAGDEFLVDFRLDPWPVFVYRVDGVELEKRVFMVHGENTTAIEYVLRGAGTARLAVRPLIAFRDYHSTTRRNDALNPNVETAPGRATVQPYGTLPALHFHHTAARLQQTAEWYFRFEYDIERERGLDFEEDLFNPCLFEFELLEGAPASLVATLEPGAVAGVAELRRRELARRAELDKSVPEPVRSLAVAADQFLVNRGQLKTVIAGYHWFADWGRDTMIALPGLALATGRHGIARDILAAFAGHASEGMLPNRFPDAGDQPEYNTVDATLWFFEAARAYLQYSGDEAFVLKQIYPVLVDILDWHIRGTRYGIAMDEHDALLACGAAGVQLTWMDAKIGDWVVTPREGKPVEIQALWYNALMTASQLARLAGDRVASERYAGIAARAAESFAAQFWNAGAQCLFDCIGRDGVADDSIRPNQIFAVSLHYPVLGDTVRSRRMLETVERELLTPAGLRSLAPADKNYRGIYTGGVWERDSAYHQGTIWPWLLGPFLTAYLRAFGRTKVTQRKASEWLQDALRHYQRDGLIQIPEIADGDSPHAPKGCLAQAWSVSELLRAAVEDVYADSQTRSSTHQRRAAAVCQIAG